MSEHTAVFAGTIMPVGSWLFAARAHVQGGFPIGGPMHTALQIARTDPHFFVETLENPNMFICPAVRSAHDCQFFIVEPKMLNTVPFNERQHLEWFHRAARKGDQIGVAIGS